MTKLVTFEDLAEGAVFWGEEVAADMDEMLNYAWKYDPWPFHVDAEAAKQTSFGGLVASAGYTFSLWCRSLHTIFRTPDVQWAFLGGYDLRVKLLEPVRPGDRLRLKLSIGHKRLSSKAGRLGPRNAITPFFSNPEHGSNRDTMRPLLQRTNAALAPAMIALRSHVSFRADQSAPE